MPLLKRVVWPSHVARVPIIEEWVRDESGRVFPALIPATDTPQDLDAFTNLTLANLISQLSSLSRHAEDLFGELITESTAILNRSVSLQGRVDKLSVKVKNLDSNVEEVSLQDIHMRKAFKSSTLFDQQVVTRDTVPAAMQEQYEICEQPPPLQELNPYRDDGKDGLKFYTDPSYFFNLWKEEMKQETERLKHDKKKPSKPKTDNRPRKQKIRKANLIREKHKQKALEAGEVLVEKNHYRAPSNQNQVPYEQATIVDGRPMRPNSIELHGHYALTGSFPPEGGSYPQEEGSYPIQGNRAHSPQGEDHYYGTSEHYNASYPDQYQGTYIPPSYSPDNSNLPSAGTPTRNGIQRALSSRPTQPPPAPPSGSNTPTPPSTSRDQTPTRVRGPSQSRDTLPPPPLPPSAQEVSHRQDLPPPPPTPDKLNTSLPPPSPPPILHCPDPPPPPPPPPPMTNGSIPAMAPPPIPNGDIKQGLTFLKKVKPEKLRPRETDARCDLLKAIRDGIHLRKVDDKPKPKDDSDPGGDVASILQRRFAFEFSDSESSADSESDSEEWPEAST